MNKTFTQFKNTINDIVELKEVPEEKLCESITEGKWSIIQIVGHLYYWDKYNLEKMIPYMAEGADLPNFPEHDRLNEEAMSFIKDYSVVTLINSFVSTRKELNDRISRLDKDVRFTIGGGKRKFSGESFIKIFVKHDAHHLEQINGKLQN